jgi:hypothetical protein
MRLRKSRYKRTQIAFGQPLGQAPLQDALPAAPDPGDHNHRPRPARMRRAEKASERGAASILVVPMQIQRATDFDAAASDALLCAAVLRLG